MVVNSLSLSLTAMVSPLIILVVLKKAYLYLILQTVLMVGVFIGPYFDEHNGLHEVGKIILVVGAIMVLLSYQYVGKAFTPSPIPKDSGELATDGIYAYARHP